ncbi:MAG: acyl-CoA thioesterase [Bacteroidetes bacterium]|nr:acyl-CoA thioesterase [Bacteroidota bacterium]
MLIHKTNIRVRYADTDQMQFVYNGKYAEYFEVSRTEMMRELGLTYKVIEENGYQMPLIKIQIEYKNPAFYDELLEVETRVEKLPAVRVHLDYTVRSKERNVEIANGYTVLVFINSKTKKISRVPEFFLEKLRPIFE